MILDVDFSFLLLKKNQTGTFIMASTNILWSVLGINIEEQTLVCGLLSVSLYNKAKLIWKEKNQFQSPLDNLLIHFVTAELYKCEYCVNLLIVKGELVYLLISTEKSQLEKKENKFVLFFSINDYLTRYTFWIAQ